MGRRARVGGWLVMLVTATLLARAQEAVDVAIQFFSDGGAYCFRVIPAGVAAGSETQ